VPFRDTDADREYDTEQEIIKEYEEKGQRIGEGQARTIRIRREHHVPDEGSSIFDTLGKFRHPWRPVDD
jgi:hypothetical protein